MTNRTAAPKSPRTPRAPKGTPTGTNLFALGSLFPVGTDVIANRVESTSAPHIRRCMNAGLVVPSHDRASLLLTDEGRAALAAYDAAYPSLAPVRGVTLAEAEQAASELRPEVVQRFAPRGVAAAMMCDRCHLVRLARGAR